jgi:membrane protease YdiL (CAAX protease family)
MFAGIHPQGFIGILPLTTIAMMCCGLTYQTKSLVPGMILHAVNNFSIMVITIVMGNYLDGMF